MLEIIVIGITSMVTLIWLLASTMATESDAEKRRLSTPAGASVASQEGAAGSETRHAA
ncbi:MAG: hypothetical protein HY581_07380 [Nitrospirae bacterium]|nr:hypothetical protein [Nitrospirota bacterium]